MTGDITKVCVLAAADRLHDNIYRACQNMAHSEVTSFRSGRDTLSYLRKKSANLIVTFSDIEDMHWSTFIRSLYTDAAIGYTPCLFFFEKMLAEDKQHLSVLPSYGVTQILNFPGDLRLFQKCVNSTINNARSVESMNHRLVQVKSGFRDGMLAEAKTALRLLKGENPKHLGVTADTFQALKAESRQFSEFILKLIEADPQNYHFQFELLANYLATGRYGLFLALFDQVMEEVRAARDSYWLSQLGAVCVNLRSPQLAEVFESRLARVIANNERWMLELLRSRIKILQGRVAEAKAHLDSAVTGLGTERPETLNLRAMIARRRGRLGEAVSALLEALKLTPEDYRLEYNIAVMEMERGDKTSAIRHLQSAVAKNPRYVRAVVKLRELTF